MGKEPPMLQLVDESLYLLSHSSFTLPAFAMNLQATVQPTITPVLLFHAVSDLINNIYIAIDDCFFLYCPTFGSGRAANSHNRAVAQKLIKCTAKNTLEHICM